MKPEVCRNCGSREFLRQESDYVCPYCDTRYSVRNPEPETEKNSEKRAARISVPAPRPADTNPPYGSYTPPTPAKAPAGRQKNKWVALILWFLFGVYGGHKFYEGKIGMGILYFFTAGLFCIGWLVDFFVLLFKPNPYYV